MPDWYPLMRAARYLGVPPWELLQQAGIWQTWALTAEGAESEAQDLIQQRNAPAA